MSGEVRMVPISGEEAATLHEHAANLAAQHIRVSDGRRPPGPGEALVAMLVDRFDQAEEGERG